MVPTDVKIFFLEPKVLDPEGEKDCINAINKTFNRLIKNLNDESEFQLKKPDPNKHVLLSIETKMQAVLYLKEEIKMLMDSYQAHITILQDDLLIVKNQLTTEINQSANYSQTICDLFKSRIKKHT